MSNITFINSPADIDWLFSTHLKNTSLRRGCYHSALLFGNEDSPEGIHLYASAEPDVFDTPYKISFGEKKNY